MIEQRGIYICIFKLEIIEGDVLRGRVLLSSWQEDLTRRLHLMEWLLVCGHYNINHRIDAKVLRNALRLDGGHNVWLRKL